MSATHHTETCGQYTVNQHSCYWRTVKHLKQSGNYIYRPDWGLYPPYFTDEQRMFSSGWQGKRSQLWSFSGMTMHDIQDPFWQQRQRHLCFAFWAFWLHISASVQAILMYSCYIASRGARWQGPRELVQWGRSVSLSWAVNRGLLTTKIPVRFQASPRRIYGIRSCI